MNQFYLVYPMFAMVLLTAVVLAKLFRTRVRAVARGDVKGSYYKTYRGDTEPDIAVQLSRQFANLFEAPTLFYVGCIVTMISGQTNLLTISLAWAYVAARIIHTYIHVGSNKLRPRIGSYFASWLLLVALWLVTTAGIATS